MKAKDELNTIRKQSKGDIQAAARQIATELLKKGEDANIHAGRTLRHSRARHLTVLREKQMLEESNE